MLTRCAYRHQGSIDEWGPSFGGRGGAPAFAAGQVPAVIVAGPVLCPQAPPWPVLPSRHAKHAGTANSVLKCFKCTLTSNVPHLGVPATGTRCLHGTTAHACLSGHAVARSRTCKLHLLAATRAGGDAFEEWGVVLFICHEPKQSARDFKWVRLSGRPARHAHAPAPAARSLQPTLAGRRPSAFTSHINPGHSLATGVTWGLCAVCACCPLPRKPTVPSHRICCPRVYS